jgi:hypothetical protein
VRRSNNLSWVELVLPVMILFIFSALHGSKRRRHHEDGQPSSRTLNRQ